ncbi:MAG TPA: tetratricopeptide repeat protein [candidate division Zixibacteria bacterium]|nr:tetratricopeptide repeat protein [candidate division Zixibacteria bacterium]
MNRFNKTGRLFHLPVLFVILMLIGCSGGKEKMPITTTSDEALGLFVEGRDFSERLWTREAIDRFDKAIAIDSEFAMAHLYRALVATSPKEYFEYLDKARTLVDKTSEAERLIILGVEAGNHANPMQQLEYYRKLVELYPDDERARFWLVNHYFSQQEYNLVAEEAEKIIDINSKFSPIYNQLGYAYRFLGDYENAEKAFQKYIKLIPDDPNPYDSYADLLMKMGKYGESIESYYKALKLDETFAASHIGIAANLNYLDKYEDARDQLRELYDLAADDGLRRNALLAIAVSYVDEGKLEQAIETIDEAYILAEGAGDAAAMANDLVQKGYIYLEMEKYKKAGEVFNRALQVIEESSLQEEIKVNARRNRLYNQTRLSLLKHDLKTARDNSIEFRKQVEEINNPNQIRRAHELAGLIALEEGNYDMAIAEFRQTSQQNPLNLFFMARSYQGKGDVEKTKEWLKNTVEFNSSINMAYSLVRKKAKRMLAQLEQRN